MNVHKLLSVFAVATLAILSQVQLGWTGEYRTKPQSVTRSGSRQPQPLVVEDVCIQQQSLAEDDGKQPLSPVEDDCMQPETGYCDGDDCASDECSGRCMRRCACVCPPMQLYGEFLYLRPLNAGVEYAVPINGPIDAGQVPIEMGRTASADPNFSSGYRVGGAFWLNDCSTISLTYSRYENNIDDAISVNPPLVIRSMVVHPSSLNADADWLAASAHQLIKFDLGDLDYRHVFYSNECTSINYLVGIRYASLKQRFDSQFESIILENVDTEINFEGGGFRLGLEAERGRRCYFGYAKASASFLGGEFHSSYLQSNTNVPVIAQTDWKEARFVSILDCEVGIGWKSCNGRVRASAGYMVSSWLNVVKTSEFISSVQANKYHGPDKINGNGLVFDGFVAHVEYGW